MDMYNLLFLCSFVGIVLYLGQNSQNLALGNRRILHCHSDGFWHLQFFCKNSRNDSGGIGLAQHGQLPLCSCSTKSVNFGIFN